MTWLNALLAFSLAMIIFCTMASAVQELLQHVLRSRERWLRGMVVKFLEDTVRRKLPGLPTSATALAEKLLENRAIDGSKEHRPLDWIAPKELFLRLAESEVGDELKKLGTDVGEKVLRQWADAFDRMQGDASALFATRARTISVFIAIGLAFALNVDAVRLFNTFLTDDQLTARFLAQADTIQKQYKDQAAATAAAAKAAPTAGDAEALADNGKVIEEKTKALKQYIDQSSALGLPFGSHFFPYCAAPSNDPLCTGAASPCSLEGFKSVGRWLASVLLAGVLIGLGGPFWFNAFTSLSAMVQSLRAPSTALGKAAGEKPAPPPPPTTAETARAAAEHLAASDPITADTSKVRGRILLSPRGTPL